MISSRLTKSVFQIESEFIMYTHKSENIDGLINIFMNINILIHLSLLQCKLILLSADNEAYDHVVILKVVGTFYYNLKLQRNFSQKVFTFAICLANVISFQFRGN